MYSSDRFLEFAGEHFDRAVSKVEVSEMREFKRFDEERRRRAFEIHRHRMEFEARSAQLEAERMSLLRDIQHTDAERSMMEHSRQVLLKHVNSEDPAALSQLDFERLEEFAARSAELEHRASFLRDRVSMLTAEQNSLQGQLNREANKSRHDNPYHPPSFDVLH
jgi:hypothetical protein